MASSPPPADTQMNPKLKGNYGPKKRFKKMRMKPMVKKSMSSDMLPFAKR